MRPFALRGLTGVAASDADALAAVLGAPGSLGKTANSVPPPSLRPLPSPRPGPGADRAASPLVGEGAPAERGRGGAGRRLTWLAARLAPHHPTRVRESEDGTVHPQPSRTSLCGWATQAGSYAAITRCTDATGTHAGVRGVQTCGSVWTCASCATVVASERASEVTRAVEAARARGDAVYLLTLTVRHGYADALRTMRAGIADAWRATTRGAPWMRWRDRYGLACIRRLEATVGPNGWHPHVHVLVIAERELPEREFAAWMRERWSAAVASHLGPEHVGEAPFDVDLERVGKLASAARYLSKLGLEITDAFARKAARGVNRSPWQLLLDYDESMASDVDASESIARWREWTSAMHGARQLTWSRGLRERSGLCEDETPDDIIAERAELDGEVALVIPPGCSREMLGLPWTRRVLLDAVERGDSLSETARALRDAAGGVDGPRLYRELLRWNTPAHLAAANGALRARRDALGAELRRLLTARSHARGEWRRPAVARDVVLGRMTRGWLAGDAKRRARYRAFDELESSLDRLRENGGGYGDV